MTTRKRRRTGPSGRTTRRRTGAGQFYGRGAMVIAPRQRGFVRVGGSYGRYAGDNAEMKFHDVDIDDAVVAAGGTIQAALLTIPEGNGEEQRIGRKLNIKRIGWRYSYELPDTATAASSSDVIRIMLILDKQANGALPVVTDILETADFQSFNSLSNSQRFRVIMDKTHQVTATAAISATFGETRRVGQFFKRCNIAIELDL